MERRALPFFLSNENNATETLCFELGYPVPLAPVAETLKIVFPLQRQNVQWQRIVVLRAKLELALSQGIICNNEEALHEQAIDEFSIKLSTLVGSLSSLTPPLIDYDQALPTNRLPRFCWRSSLNGMDYASCFLHLENYMAQLVAFVFHFNAAMRDRLDSVEGWQTHVKPCESERALELALDLWTSQDKQRRQHMMEEYGYAAAALERARRALSLWRALPRYTTLRYPPEVSHELVRVLEKLIEFWTQNAFVELHSAGIVFVVDKKDLWRTPKLERQPSAQQLCELLRWLMANGLMLARYLGRYHILDNKTELEHVQLVRATTAWCARAALYQRACALAASAEYDQAYECVLALEALDWSANDGFVYKQTTIFRLRSHIYPKTRAGAPIGGHEEASVWAARGELALIEHVKPRLYTELAAEQ